MQPFARPRALYLPLIGKTARSTRTVTRFTSATRGGCPEANDVKVDITLREMLVYALQERPVLRRYEELTDLPENRMVRAYSLEEITTEKTLALADRARNEPRDHLRSLASYVQRRRRAWRARGRDAAKA